MQKPFLAPVLAGLALLVCYASTLRGMLHQIGYLVRVEETQETT